MGSASHGTRTGSRLRWRRGRLVASVAALGCLFPLLWAGPAHAFILVSASVEFPSELRVGDTVTAEVGISNFSTPPDSAVARQIAQIDLVPVCSNPTNTCPGGIEPGAFEIGSTGLGTAGLATCAGTWAIAQTTPGTYRLTPPGGEGTLSLMGGAFCVVSFTVRPVRVPTTDVSPAEAGVQTNQVVCATNMTPIPVRNCGLDAATVLPGPPAGFTVFRPSDGTWYFRDGPAVHWGTSGDLPVVADYDGNGTQDVAVWRPSNGIWFVRNGPTVQWGTSGDLPVPADYDGDGDDDIAVWRPSTGEWFIRDGLYFPLGLPDDVPVPADYTAPADGIDDLATFDDAQGIWRGLPVHFGAPGDIPVPADYNGDGTDDTAVFRPSTGQWYVGQSAHSAIGANWGTSGDVPVPADYDGDGGDDFAVWRPSNGIWFVRNGPVAQWGTSGDIPVHLPSAVYQAYFP